MLWYPLLTLLSSIFHVCVCVIGYNYMIFHDILHDTFYDWKTLQLWLFFVYFSIYIFDDNILPASLYTKPTWKWNRWHLLNCNYVLILNTKKIIINYTGCKYIINYFFLLSYYFNVLLKLLIVKNSDMSSEMDDDVLIFILLLFCYVYFCVRLFAHNLNASKTTKLLHLIFFNDD